MFMVLYYKGGTVSPTYVVDKHEHNQLKRSWRLHKDNPPDHIVGLSSIHTVRVGGRGTRTVDVSLLDLVQIEVS